MNNFGNLFLWLLLTGAAAAFVLVYRRVFRFKSLGHRILDSVFLEIRVPKETTAADKEQEAVSDEKDVISVAEQLLTTLSHREPRGVWGFFVGPPSLSFEIVSVEKKITFLINCPRRQRDLVEKQIHAQYAAAQIDEVLPPKVVRDSRYVAAAELGLQKRYFFPIKTYKLMESDPLNSLTNSLSKLQADEGGIIQITASPAGHWWRQRVVRRARDIQKGKPIEAVSSAGSAVANAIFEGTSRVASEFFGSKKKNDGYLSGHSSQEQMHPLTPLQQEAVKRLEEKSSKGAFEVNVRVVVSSRSHKDAQSHMRNILSSFMQYTQAPFNGFRVITRSKRRVTRDMIYRRFEPRVFRKVLLNTEELTSLFHLPTKFMQTPNIKWLQAKRAPAPVNAPAEGLLLGTNIYRGVKTEIRIAKEDRRRHMYVIGRTGTGKSEFMKGLIRQDIENGEGVAVVDPHGDLVDDLLQFVPKERAEDVVIFEPFDLERPMGLNMLEVKSEEEKDFAVQEMIEIFYKLFPPEIIGPMFEHNMRNVMLTLMADREHPGTIAEIPRMFTDPAFQRYKVAKVQDPVVRSFWEQEMAKTTDFHKSEMLGYLISKVGRFVENEMMRNIIGQPKSAFDFRQVMDEGKILLINLSKGKTGEVNSKLLGLIIVSKLQMAALSRADVPEEKRRDFYLYIDEFQNFVTDSLATILSEARKYRLSLTMAHQYIAQLAHDNNTKIRDAVFGNAGTISCFRIGVEDAEIMAREFAPVFNEYDVINIERFSAYMKLMINGTASRPFSMQTMPPIKGRGIDLASGIRKLSKLKYSRSRAEVETEIRDRAQLGKVAQSMTGAVERTA
ncbi:MAG: hypothetical protein UY65_C0010G0004 [Parcubacteria group bacterium GW2011_GWA2_51_12]|nr:MAG: hypothetical protein UY65_C0010G0004 [Parcubacteria group bacterium GW2011_GWA2_51_12]